MVLVLNQVGVTLVKRTVMRSGNGFNETTLKKWFCGRQQKEETTLTKIHELQIPYWFIKRRFWRLYLREVLTILEQRSMQLSTMTT